MQIFTKSLQFKIQRRSGSHTTRLTPRVLRALDSGCTAFGSTFLGPRILPTLLLSLLWAFSTPRGCQLWFLVVSRLPLAPAWHSPPTSTGAESRAWCQASPGRGGGLDEHPLLSHPGFPLLPLLTPPPMLPLMMEVGLEGVSEIIYTRTYKN